jgi:hypothetical protein
MPINFPNSPSPSQLYSYDNKTWEWNGTYWEVYSALTSYITSAYTVGDGFSDISGVTGGNIALKSFSGVGITITDGGDKLTFTTSTNYLPLSGGTVTGATNFTGGLSANTISATTYQNLPQSVSGGGTSNYISKWTGSTGLGDSQIVDDGSQVYIGANGILGSLFSVVGPVGVNEFQIQATGGSLGITDTDLSAWTTGGGEVAIGSNGPLASSIGSNNVAIGSQSMASNTSGSENVAVGRRSLTSNQAGQANVAIGFRAGGDVDSGSYNVFIGYDAGGGVTTEDNRLYIANNTYGTLIYGEFDNGIVNIDGTLSATTYDNLPGSSSANCFTTFYVTNISGCSPVNVLSPLNVQDGINVTGTSTFTSQVNFTGGLSASTFSAGTYQNLPSFNSVQINGTTQFSGDTNNFINFSGINVTITSAATNTLVFSAGTGGGASGNFLPISGGTIEGNLIVTGNTNISGTTTSSGNLVTLQNLQSLFSSGDEGGEITLSKPQTNSTISGTAVTVDIHQNKLRFFEQGGTNRGAYIDITSAAPGVGTDLLAGAGGGTVTSVTLAAGTTGTDVNISNPTITTSGTITLNIPDASTTARGLITTGTQTILGNKTIGGNLTITGNTTISGLTASQLIATDANDTLVSLSTSTYPSLTELTYVKGLTASTQTQLNNKTDYYSILVNQGGTNFADSTTYYIGLGGYLASTIANTRNVYVPFTSTLTNVLMTAGASNAASTQDTTVYFRLNNTTDTLLSSTVKFSGGNAQANGTILSYSISGLSVSVNAGDFFEIKLVTPVWTTNPTAGGLTVLLYFRK